MITWVFACALLGFLLLLLLLTRKMRAMGKKLGQVTRDLGQLQKDLREGLKESDANQWEHYRESEIHAQLLNLLKFTEPIPPTRSWAASPDLLMTLVESVRGNKPELIIELGSGISTLMMAKSLPAGSKTKIISFDHSAEFAQITRDLLEQHSITGVEIRVAPLEQYDSQRTWYSKKAFADISNIDLLVVDGPPGSKDPQARSGARLELASKLSARATVIIDDADRDGEHAMAQAFAEVLPSHTLRFLPHEKGTAVISPS